MDKLYQNKEAFLSEKPAKLFVLSLLIIIFSICLILLLAKKESYDHYLTKGIVKCEENCKVIVAVPTNIQFTKIKYNNKYWSPKILSKEIKIDEEQVISYNIYTLESNFNFEDKEIIDLNICYNKQRILKKFIKKIF